MLCISPSCSPSFTAGGELVNAMTSHCIYWSKEETQGYFFLWKVPIPHPVCFFPLKERVGIGLPFTSPHPQKLSGRGKKWWENELHSDTLGIPLCLHGPQCRVEGKFLERHSDVTSHLSQSPPFPGTSLKISCHLLRQRWQFHSNIRPVWVASYTRPQNMTHSTTLGWLDA